MIFAVLGKITDDCSCRPAPLLRWQDPSAARAERAEAVDRRKIYVNGVQRAGARFRRVRLGEIVAMIGGSGCGKSTLLRLIAGLDRATSATSRSAATRSSAARHSASSSRSRAAAMASVADNLGFGLSDLPAQSARAVAAAGAGRACRQADRWPRELSGGQAQRVPSHAHWSQPEVLLLDEPFSALDAFTRGTCRTICWRCGPRGRPVLVTHDVDEAVLLADRIA